MGRHAGQIQFREDFGKGRFVVERFQTVAVQEEDAEARPGTGRFKDIGRFAGNDFTGPASTVHALIIPGGARVTGGPAG